MQNRRTILLVLAVITALIPLVTTATPPLSQSGTSLQGTPVPEVQCTVEPRTVDELTRLVSQATPSPSFYVADELPSGEPADADTVDAVTRTVLERIECRKTGDWLRWLALATDDYIRRTTLPDAGTPPPPPSTPNPPEFLQNLRLLSIQNAMGLDDGRVSAIVTLGGTEDAHPAPGRTFLMFFSEVDGQWLLDEQYLRVFSGGGTPTFIAELIATPTAEPATPAP